MDNDKLFAAYALVIFAGVASVITTAIVTGTAAVPSPVSFLEHLALSFGFRTAYKSFGGMSWDDWSILPDRGTAAQPAADAHPTTA